MMNPCVESRESKAFRGNGNPLFKLTPLFIGIYIYIIYYRGLYIYIGDFQSHASTSSNSS